MVIVVGCGDDPSVDSEMEVCWFWLGCVDCCLISIDLLINSSQGEMCVLSLCKETSGKQSRPTTHRFLWMQSLYVTISEMFWNDYVISNLVFSSTTSVSWEAEQINGEETDNRSDSVPNTLSGHTSGWGTEGRSRWRKRSETFITIFRYKRRSLLLHLHRSSAKADGGTVSQHAVCHHKPLWDGSAASRAKKTARAAGEAPGPAGSGGGPCLGGESPAQRE